MSPSRCNRGDLGPAQLLGEVEQVGQPACVDEKYRLPLTKDAGPSVVDDAGHHLARMTGVTNFVPKNAPFACTASTRSQSCSDVCSRSNEARIPALFTNTSRRP